MLKNITLSAEMNLIQKARRRAGAEHKTLNQLFRDWMTRYVGGPVQAESYTQKGTVRHFSIVEPAV